MGMREDAERNRLALIDQLYDQWGGHYCVLRLDPFDHRWKADHDLTKAEAIEYKPGPDEALGLVWHGSITLDLAKPQEGVK